MAFSTQRGRPRKPTLMHDTGTPELRLKHALRITAEPIDLCLEKLFITQEQHWCGLHLRWLYTLRYGAPNMTTIYADQETSPSLLKNEDPTWRAMREKEYHEAIRSLKTACRYESVMRLSIHNESPAFLNARLQQAALAKPQLQHTLNRTVHELREGLTILARLWRQPQLL